MMVSIWSVVKLGILILFIVWDCHTFRKMGDRIGVLERENIRLSKEVRLLKEDDERHSYAIRALETSTKHLNPVEIKCR